MSEENNNILDNNESSQNEQEIINNKNIENDDFRTDSNVKEEEGDTLYFTDELQNEPNNDENPNNDI